MSNSPNPSHRPANPQLQFSTAEFSRLRRQKSAQLAALAKQSKRASGAAASDPGILRPAGRIAQAGDSGDPLGIWEIEAGDSHGPLGSVGDAPLLRRVGLGFHADLPDIRDHGPEQLAGFRSHCRLPIPAGSPDPIAGYRHLGEFGPLPPVEDQGPIGSCTAQAVIGMAEIQILRHTGRALDLSRMFLYKSTRRLLGWSGDTGAFVRTTIKALRVFGSLPEEYWPYRADLLDAEPDAFAYSYAQTFQGLRYARLDRYGGTGGDALREVKTALDGGDPVALGFTVYRSISAMAPDFVIPVPRSDEPRVGGHAVIAVGYNDHVSVPGQTGTGALIIRNSWSEAWGDHGYAYLPYWYVQNQIAVDFWALYGQEWLDLFTFDQPQTTTNRAVG